MEMDGGNIISFYAAISSTPVGYQFLIVLVPLAQVTIARVYNWDVHQRRIRQIAASAATQGS